MSRPSIVGSVGVYDLNWDGKEPVKIHVSRVRTDRYGATHAELRILAPAEKSPLLQQTRMNLTSSQARKHLAEQLTDQYPGDWSSMLQQMSYLVLERERAGEPVLRISSDDFVKPRRNLLPPLLPEREPTVVFGPGGSGKSLFVTLVGILAASGKAHKSLGLAPVERHNVLYLDWEHNEDELRRRIRRLAKALALDEPVGLNYRRCIASLADDVEAIQEACRQCEVGLVIVDSLVPACGGGEDLMVSGAPSRFFQALRRLDVTALIVAHPTKNAEQKTIYGSVFFTNLARSVWEVETHQGEGEDSIALGLFHRKSNLSRLERPLGVEFLFDGEDGPIEARARDVTTIPHVAGRMTVAKRISGLLARSGPLCSKDIAERLEAPSETIRKELWRMEGKGTVVTVEGGLYAVPSWEDGPTF